MPDSNPVRVIPSNTLLERTTTPAETEPLADENTKAMWQAQHELDWHRAETERLKVLVDFLSNPIHAHGGADPDPDIIIAYNLAVEAALRGIRRASLRGNP